MTYIDVRCPYCSRLLLRCASTANGSIEVKCPRTGKRSHCGWQGTIDLSSSPTPGSTISPPRIT